MWGSDGTKILTQDNGWVLVFSVEEHWNGECLGWHVCKNGDRFAAFEPIMQGVKKAYGTGSKGEAKGLKLCIATNFVSRKLMAVHKKKEHDTL